MVAPVDRPSGVLAGTFGVGILTFLLLPSEVGYQDLAALIARDVASVERPQKTSLASPFGTIHVANLNLPQPIGSSIKPSLDYTLAALDPSNAEITGSIRERILRESAVLLAPDGTGPWIDRSRKSDQLTATQRNNDQVAVKGDRLAAPPVQQQAQAEPQLEAEALAPQIAAAPSVDATVVATAGVPAPSDLEAENIIAVEKQIADAAVDAGQMQMAELPPRDADQAAEGIQQAEGEPDETTSPTRQAKSDTAAAERGAEAKQKASQQADKTPTRQAQSSKRSQRLTRAQREEQRRAERIARDARQKAEKLARSQDAPKPTAKLARTAAPKSESVERASPTPSFDAAQDQRINTEAPQTAETASPNGFVLASAGDYRIGLDTRQFERDTAPAATAAVPGNPADAAADAAPGKADALNAIGVNAIASADATPTQRESRRFFGGNPMGKKAANLQPWSPGAAPRLGEGARGGVAVGAEVSKNVEVKLAALPPATTDSAAIPSGIPNQSVGKDPNAQGGQSIAPKGEVTGADKRPMTPAERLGLNDEKSRAKTVKCLTEVIYFESRGEVVRGQMAVAQVVLNRAFSGKYPNTVCGVVYQNAHRHLACQFTFACDGIADKVKEPDMWERATVIANEMLDGKIWLPEVGKATHYHAHWVRPGWVREMNKLYRVGVHTFYRPRNWGDGSNAPEWGDQSETQEVAKKLVEVARKP